MEKIVKKIANIRGVPQFIFNDDIKPNSSVFFRGKVIDFLGTHKGVKEIDFIINSGGGSADDAYRIIKCLRSNFETVNIVIPFWAKSAATLLSLGGTNIIMDDYGEFGPLDMQISKEKEDGPDRDRESALVDEVSLQRIEIHAHQMYRSMFDDLYKSKSVKVNKEVLSQQIFEYIANFYQPILRQIDPYKMGDKRRKLDIAEHYANRILGEYCSGLSADNRKFFVDYLVNECPDHGYIIDYNFASILLPSVKKTDKYGEEYKKEVSKLSILFMKCEDKPCIDIILPDEPIETKKKKKGDKRK